MQISEDVLTKIFEDSFDDKVENIRSRKFLISFEGAEYSMEYNFLNGYIAFEEWCGSRIGTIFVSECNISSYEIDPLTTFGYCVGLFERKLKKFIELNQKKTRRKFISR